MRKIIQFERSIPIPTKDNPLAQIDWVFDRKIEVYENKSTRENYRTAKNFYKKYLGETNNYSDDLEQDNRFFIEREWNRFAFYKICKWHESVNIKGTDRYITSHTAVGLLSAVRQTIEYAYENGWISEQVINIPTAPAVSETDVRSAYSDLEYADIFQTLTPQIQFSKSLLKPYQKTGIGSDPRRINRTGTCTLRGEKVLNQGWACYKLTDGLGTVATDDNMRWYFENEMNCEPLAGTPENKIKHGSFFSAATNIHGGLRNLYKKWGVSTYIDRDIIMPLIVELTAETGMNVNSILTLKRDCLKESHPLLKLPILEYNKPRSGGEKILALNLLDSEVEPEYLGLGQKESLILAKTINQILHLTEPLVKLANPKDANYLFLYQSSGVNGFGKVQRVNNQNVTCWTKRFIENSGITSKNGEPLQFNLSRFRPTKITEMVRQGFDIFQIMSVAGHASITTTFSYIDELKISSHFDETINKHLTDIKNNAAEYRRKPLPIAQQNISNPQNFIFKTPLCHCKNPYDPPAQVKKAKNFREGDACSYWNMCLQCPNILITETSLSNLIAYKREIERSMRNGINDMPMQGELYKKILMILEQVLKPGDMFTEDEIVEASNNTPDDKTVIDPFIF